MFVARDFGSERERGEEKEKKCSGRKLSGGADFAPSTQTDRQPLKRHRPETAAVVRPYLTV